MGTGKKLTAEEISQIQILVRSGKKVPEIARLLKRSEKVWRNYLKLRENYGSNHPGAKKKLNPRDLRRVFKEVSNKSVSCAQVKHNLSLNVTRQTVYNALKDNSNLKFKKMKKKPPLNNAHKLKRVNWARDKVGWNNEWKYVIFSDEKKFNLDGPDGFSCYWHDFRKEERIFSKRHSGGGSLMIWAGFSFYGKTTLRIISTRMTAVGYQNVLDEHLLPFLDEMPLEDLEKLVFMQDNAPVHRANSVKAWFENHRINVVDWPPYSPDLNPIENVWGILARRVYSNGRQFQSVKELREAVFRAWKDFTAQDLRPFIESMKSRVSDVLLGNGRSIDK